MTKLIDSLLFIASALLLLAAADPSSYIEETRSLARPRAEWEVVFADEISLEEYARQLDYFKIEVAAVAKDNKIEYVSKVSARKPDKHLGRREEDPRLYIGWKSGTLEAVDRKLLAKARVNSQRKEILHYFPSEAQEVMERLERDYAKRDPSQIKRTRFEIHAKASGGYQFVVVEQDAHDSATVETAARRQIELNKPLAD